MRENAAQGGVIGEKERQNYFIGGAVTQGIKNLDFKLAGEALNFFKDKVVNAETTNEARKFLNKIFSKEREINPVLNKISIDKISKDGSVLYSVKTPDGPLYGKGLDNIIPKRDSYFFAKEKPFREAGYIPSDEAASFLKEKGFATRKKDASGKGVTTAENDQNKKFNPIVKVLGNLTKKYDIDTKQGPGYGGKQIFIKKTDLENKTDQIVKDYLPKEQKLTLAKNIAEELGTESFFQINKALKERGYSSISNVDLNKYFKKFKGTTMNDPEYVPSGTPSSVIQKIRRDKIKTYGAPNVEKALIAVKKNLGFGQKTELMHPLTKKKATKSLYEPEDLMFGSFKENRQYNMGLEGVRNTVQNTLIKTKNQFNVKDLKSNITIDVPNYLRRDFNFPKEMPIKKYIDKLNYMMTDIGLKTDGKIRGALLDDNFKLIENKLGVNYKNIPGMGLIEDNLKSLDPLFKKLKYDRSKGYETGELLFDDKGMPLIKKGKKLTNEEAETLVSFLGNISEEGLEAASMSQPVPIKEVKEVFNRIPKRSGGYIAGGVKDIYNKYYRGSDLEALLENPQALAAELGLGSLEELFRLFGLYSQGGIVSLIGKKK